MVRALRMRYDESLTEAVVHAYPAFPPFAGEFAAVIPHLTVAHGNASEAEAAGGALTIEINRRSSCASTN